MKLKPLDSDLIARVDVLENDRDHLYQGLGAFEGLVNNAIVRQKADRQLIMAIRTTQSEHGNTLLSLVDGQERLEQSQRKLLDGQVRLEQDFAGMKVAQTQLKDGQVRLETKFDQLENRFDQLENRFGQMENKFDRLENRFDRLELLVRKGFGMESEN